MLKSISSVYSDAYIFAKGTITVVGAGATAAARQIGRNNRQATFKHCTPQTDCITGLNNTQIVNLNDIDVVMSII